jgi:HEAT repeat protein
MDEEKSLDELRALLASKTTSDRVLALKLIAEHKHYSLSNVCIEKLRDPHRDVRSHAAWALDRMAYIAAVPDLCTALYDPVFNVRSSAGWALIHIAMYSTPNVVVPDVIDVLLGPESDAQQMAYIVLHHIGGETAREAIREYWSKH